MTGTLMAIMPRQERAEIRRTRTAVA